MSDVAMAQSILDGPWKHASAALDACRNGAWPAFVRDVAPARPRVLGRVDHARAIATAETSPTGPITASVQVVPLWGCVTAEAPSSEWVAIHGVRWSGDVLRVQEDAPFFEDASPRADALWECQVRRWRAGVVVQSEAYAPSVPMLLRASAFAVLEMQVVEVLSVEVREGEPIARPAVEVPMFARQFLPRVKATPELEGAIAALCFVAEDPQG